MFKIAITWLLGTCLLLPVFDVYSWRRSRSCLTTYWCNHQTQLNPRKKYAYGCRKRTCKEIANYYKSTYAIHHNWQTMTEDYKVAHFCKANSRKGISPPINHSVHHCCMPRFTWVCLLYLVQELEHGAICGRMCEAFVHSFTGFLHL